MARAAGKMWRISMAQICLHAYPQVFSLGDELNRPSVAALSVGFTKNACMPLAVILLQCRNALPIVTGTFQCSKGVSEGSATAPETRLNCFRLATGFLLTESPEHFPLHLQWWTYSSSFQPISNSYADPSPVSLWGRQVAFQFTVSAYSCCICRLAMLAAISLLPGSRAAPVPN